MTAKDPPPFAGVVVRTGEGHRMTGEEGSWREDGVPSMTAQRRVDLKGDQVGYWCWLECGGSWGKLVRCNAPLSPRL